MGPDRTLGTADGDGSSKRRFAASCDDCPFEEVADGIDEARATAAEHKRATGHEVLALEVPATS